MTSKTYTELLREARITAGLESGLASSASIRSSDLHALTAAIFAGTGAGTHRDFGRGLFLARQTRCDQWYATLDARRAERGMA
jgi:hypothetical protein